ncbi:MAG: OmpA family protein [Treponema sp.]|jgi:outer membrane protein OmpA-like peptidoglycan-associated protein|nr:OmpA family protein [Treponema sp.]
MEKIILARKRPFKTQPGYLRLPCILIVCFTLMAAPFKVRGEDFQYIHRTGDKYRIISVVKEDVYIDKKISHRAEILNRIAVEVTDVKNGRGSHKAVFQTSERAAFVSIGAQAVNSFEWSREYESEFERDRLGYISIDPKYYMPVVRNVPVFPGKNLREGERWRADGHEMHDFRDSFGIERPYRIPFSANYVFLGERQWKGQSYPAFSVSYRIITNPQPVRGLVYPRRITGSSDQIVYWDNEKGQPAAYEETFRMMFEMSNGRTIEYTGTAEAEIVESEIMDKDKLVSEIAEVIEKMGINDTNVRAADEGITISLEDIKFLADSDVLLPEEKLKLNKIADILKLYPDRDIMVSGHTALAGTAEGRMKLSLDRAKAVTDYLLSLGVRTADRAVVRGFGAEKPVADNRTEEGMRKNRRVEITILEN